MAESDDRPGYSFDPGPPPEASRYLKNKGYLPAFSWRDVEPEEHAVSFTVAKAMRMDVLSSIRGAVQKALDEGETLETFRKNLTPELQRLGWWGSSLAVDPATGEEKLVRTGSPRRLKTIYNANLRSARAAGQWDRIQRTKEALPYLTYRLGPSERHRPAHVAREGITLPVDHPFWETWYPPNGWGCKCWVRQVSRTEAEELGISDDADAETYEHRNPRTGEVRERVKGIDVGWERNPGRLRQEAMDKLLEGKIAEAPEPVARAALADLASSWRVQRVMEGLPGWVPAGLIPLGMRAKLPDRARFLGITEMTKQHLVDEKIGQDRSRQIMGLRYLPEASEAFVVSSKEGLPTYHLLIPRSAVRSKRGQDLHLIIWLDKLGRPFVRTIFPTTARAFQQKAERPESRAFDPQ